MECAGLDYIIHDCVINNRERLEREREDHANEHSVMEWMNWSSQGRAGDLYDDPISH